MKTEFIPKVVTLLAGAVVCIVCIAKDMDTTYSLAVLLLTLILFYIIGLIAKKVIERVKESNRVMKERLENVGTLPRESEVADDTENNEESVS